MQRHRLHQHVAAAVGEVLLEIAGMRVAEVDRLDGEAQQQPGFLGGPGHVHLLGADAAGHASFRAVALAGAVAERPRAAQAALAQFLREHQCHRFGNAFAVALLGGLAGIVRGLRAEPGELRHQHLVNPSMPPPARRRRWRSRSRARRSAPIGLVEAEGRAAARHPPSPSRRRHRRPPAPPRPPGATARKAGAAALSAAGEGTGSAVGLLRLQLEQPAAIGAPDHLRPQQGQAVEEGERQQARGRAGAARAAATRRRPSSAPARRPYWRAGAGGPGSCRSAAGRAPAHRHPPPGRAHAALVGGVHPPPRPAAMRRRTAAPSRAGWNRKQAAPPRPAAVQARAARMPGPRRWREPGGEIGSRSPAARPSRAASPRARAKKALLPVTAPSQVSPQSSSGAKPGPSASRR